MTAGLATVLYFVAPKLPPNPIVGFRAGYAYVSRKVRVRLTRVSAVIFMCLGVVVATASLVLGDLAAAIILAVGAVAVLVVMIAYASRVAEVELFKLPGRERAGVGEVAPVRPTIVHVAVVAASVIISTAYTLLNYGELPNIMAVHFKWGWQPDSYLPKSEGVLTVLSFQAVTAAIALYTYYLGWRPEALYKSWYSRSDFRKVTNTIYTVVMLTAALSAVANVSTITYNMWGKPSSVLEYTIYALLAALLASSAYLATLIVRTYMRRTVHIDYG